VPAVASVQHSVYPKKDEPKYLVCDLQANPGGNTRFGLTGGLASVLGEQPGQSHLKLTGSGTGNLTASAFEKQAGRSLMEVPGRLASADRKQDRHFLRKSTDHSATVSEKHGIFCHGEEPSLPTTPRQAAAKMEGWDMEADVAESNSLWPIVNEEGEAGKYFSDILFICELASEVGLWGSRDSNGSAFWDLRIWLQMSSQVYYSPEYSQRLIEGHVFPSLSRRNTRPLMFVDESFNSRCLIDT
jgi:hypothetical protein